MKKAVYIGFLGLSQLGLSQNWVQPDTGLPRAVLCLYGDTDFLYAGMNFQNNYNNSSAIWNGTQWDTLPNPCLGGRINAIGSYQGYIHVATTCGVSQWDGLSWNMLGGPSNWGVTALCQFGQDLLAFGLFDTIGGIAASKIARWDGNSWNAFDTTAWAYCWPTCAIIYNGELYMGGNFFNQTGTIEDLAKWNGTQWMSVGMDGNDHVSCLEIYNGDLYVGGSFNTSSGDPGNGIARWNGSSWDSLGGGFTFGNGAYDMIVYNNELYVAGAFLEVANAPAKLVVKWDGYNWCSLGADPPGNGGTALGVYNNELYIGGGFTMLNGDTMRYITKWNGGNYTDSCVVVTGIGEQGGFADMISIFPNPSSGLFTIHTEDPTFLQNASLEVFDLPGRVVFSSSFNHSPIDLTSVQNGLYILKICTSKGIITKKIVKE